MTRTAHRRVLLVAVVALGMVVSGCSSVGGKSGGSANTSGAAPKGVTLTLWNTDLDSPALKDLYKAYEAASGNTLKIVTTPSKSIDTVILTKWAAGQRPDILEWQPGVPQIAKLNPQKNLLDLSSLKFVESEGDLATGSGNFKGKVYAATLGPASGFGVFYNKQIFAKAGLTPPQTYADLAKDCAAIKTKVPGVAPIYEAGGDAWPTQVLAGILFESSANASDAYVNDLLSKKAKLNDPNGVFVKGLVAYDNLRKSGCFNSDATTGTFDGSAKALLAGQAALVAQDSTSFIATLAADAKTGRSGPADKIGFVGVSETTGDVGISPTISGTYYLPKTGNTTRQRAATDFINWVTGPGYQKYVEEAQALPTMSGVTAPTQQGMFADVQRAIQKGSAPLWITNAPGGPSLGQLTGQLLAEQISPQNLANKMQVAFEYAAAAIQ